MSQLRSEDMSLVQVFCPQDQGYAAIDHLLELDMVHYVDLNKNTMPNELPFTTLLKRAEETVKKIQEIEQIYEDYAVELRAPDNIPKLKEQIDQILANTDVSAERLLSRIEGDIGQQAVFLRTQNSLLMQSCQDFRNVLARIFFLQNVADILRVDPSVGGGNDIENRIDTGDSRRAELDEGLLGATAQTSLRIVGGTVKLLEVQTLKKLIFRCTRGRALVRTFDLNLDFGDVMTNKSFTFDQLEGYVIIYDDSMNIGNVIRRVCNSFQCDFYETSISSIGRDISNAKEQKEKIKELLRASRAQFVEYLQTYNPLRDENDVSMIEVYKQFLNKDQIIYTTLNMFKSAKLLVGLVWVPTKFKDVFFERCKEISRANDLDIHTREREIDPELTIPTYFRDCEFATVGQMVVDQYEVPAYKEVNPGLFTNISFPFLFGVMFGDVFAGSLLLAAGLYFCCASPTPGSIVASVAPARHFLLLMGVFSVFCGVIYNDFTSVSMYLFGDSCWEMPAVGEINGKAKADCVYPVGLDPTWYMAQNEILFVNSVKMKIALILGVLQMSLGIVLKGFNEAYNHRWVDFIFEFIPQLVLFLCLFGFMDLMVIIKWTTDYSSDTSKAPAIINTMLNMAMNGGQPSNPHESPLFGDKSSFDDQIKLMNILMMIVMICIPLMLCVKPCYLQCCAGKGSSHVDHEDEFEKVVDSEDNFVKVEDGQKLKASEDGFRLHDNIVASYIDPNKVHGDDGFMEIMIHQIIEVIEFVLGTISNTASYLRLWALSLAHSQLAKVFYDRAMAPGFESGDILFMFVGFFVFIGATFGVLMIMDVMECFLHTLRLHWVEFMSKFYKGDGLKFTPVTIKQVLEQ